MLSTSDNDGGAGRRVMRWLVDIVIFRLRLSRRNIEQGLRRCRLKCDGDNMCLIGHCKQPANLTMFIVLPLLLLCYGAGNIHCATVHDNSEDFHSLFDFKQGITDPNGALSTWTNNTHFCRWHGVSCSSTPPYRVTGLNLTTQGLGGQISSSLGNMTFLETLDLSNNSFHGPIPLLGQLQYLYVLSLASNRLWGSIPDALTNCSNLASLDLSGNNLTGIIPPGVGLLTQLKSIVLDGNGLTGGIPSSLGNITALQIIRFVQNQLNGEIPREVMQMPHLRLLYLYQNNLSGRIPEVWQMPNILGLDLNTNNLSGRIPQDLSNVSSLLGLSLTSNKIGNTLPSNIGDALPNLTELLLSENYFEGQIPASLGKPQNLEAIDLSRNFFTGQIPYSLGNLSFLSYLNLELNMLESTDSEGWEFLDALGNCKLLTIFSLSHNKLHGAIPNSIANLSTSLTRLVMSENTLSGIVPTSIGKLSGLTQLSLDQNNLTGTIEEWLRRDNLTFLSLAHNQLVARHNQDWGFLNALRNCTSLETLCLSYNELQGSLPPSIGNLSTSLQTFLLGENNLSGQSIGKLRSLTWLELGGNNFSGTIEGWIENFKSLEKLSLESNNFTGPIPSSIGNLTWLVVLLLNENEFQGSIPDSLGTLQGLQELDLSYNNLRGYMPPNFGNLQQLIEFDLSHNNLQGDLNIDISKLQQLISLRLSSNKLSGEIPENFGERQELENLEMDQNYLIGNIPTSFKGLQSLKTLNLSHNNLSGTIPTLLEDLSLLNKLDLSYNLLQGEISNNGVFANATAVSLKGNRGLCGGVMDLHLPACPEVSQVIEWKHYLTIILITIFGFMSLGMSIYAIFLQKKMPRTPYLFLHSFGKKFPRVSYKDLAQATENFSMFNLIGRGSYGVVYQGKLTQAKIQVAIKVFDLEIKFADKSFASECEALRTIRHRNLLPILTACSTIDNNGNDFKAIIYEFMPNGNLDAWLHQKLCLAPKLLSFAQRISIGVDIADALAYLHHDCAIPIVHCDLKPTNIILDNDMNAHLGDFGIASLVVDSRSIAVGHSGCGSSLSVTGTIGYIAPGNKSRILPSFILYLSKEICYTQNNCFYLNFLEYSQTVHASTRGDVYSFGIVLLEMITGKRPTDSMFEGGLNITSFVEANFPDQVLHIIDAHLQEECKGFIKAAAAAMESKVYQCLLSLVQVALACTLRLPRDRMTMREVAINLHAIRKSYVAAIKCGQAMVV
ncbi:LOW QUALITY PROTEIN: hypothetical protein U9M48_022782 [Paspalum notatum var. saurae]|uniref:Protein kinase domain-containing protein n=1 Tax=Paspalum notatum var. saurae TaxID=547442 RepID=A0AAQ3WV58_PASNO